MERDRDRIDREIESRDIESNIYVFINILMKALKTIATLYFT